MRSGVDSKQKEVLNLHHQVSCRGIHLQVPRDRRDQRDRPPKDKGAAQRFYGDGQKDS